jgi:hypothetical protein
MAAVGREDGGGDPDGNAMRSVRRSEGAFVLSHASCCPTGLMIKLTLKRCTPLLLSLESHASVNVLAEEA